jgi:hypothetical protein
MYRTAEHANIDRTLPADTRQAKRGVDAERAEEHMVRLSFLWMAPSLFMLARFERKWKAREPLGLVCETTIDTMLVEAICASYVLSDRAQCDHKFATGRGRRSYCSHQSTMATMEVLVK